MTILQRLYPGNFGLKFKSIFLFFSLFASAQAFAQIPVSVSPQKAKVGEVIRLTFSLRDDLANKMPDLTVLRPQFSVVGSERQTNYTVVNGSASTAHELTILLIAKKAGILTIPAMTLGSETTNPLSVEVTENTEDKAQKEPSKETPSDPQKDLFIQTTVEEKNPFIHQQVNYTVKIFVKRSVMDAQYTPPQTENALIITLSQEQQYQTVIAGETYSVSEQHYAIFPQKSGEMRINPPKLEAIVYSQFPEKVSVQGQPITLKVNPEPSEYGQKPWLPAKALTLSEHYDALPTKVKQGTAFTRTITIKAIGTPAQLLPDLLLSSTEAFTVYPEKGKEINEQIQGDVVGSMTIKANYLLNKSGTVTIPDLNLYWFNLKTKQEERATLPARTLTVLPESVSSNTLPLKEHPKVAPKKESLRKALLTDPGFTQASKLPWLLAGSLALLWLLTLIFGWFFFIKKKDTQLPKLRLKNLKNACATNKPKEAEKYLLLWANGIWPGTEMHNLEDLSRLIEDPELKEALQDLNLTLYQRQPKPWKDGKKLWSALQKYLNLKTKLQKKKETLPQLNKIGAAP